MLSRPPEQAAFLAGLPRSARRAALRTLRGQLLRTELYAMDGSDREHRPYTVTETISGVREESPPPPGQPAADRERIFFPFVLGSRTTQWERGDEPMTQFTFPAGYDAYGFATGQVAIAVPRGRDPMAAVTAATPPYLATYATTEYARRDDADHYLIDRVCQATSYEVVNDGRLASARPARRGPRWPGDRSGVSLRVIGQTRTLLRRGRVRRAAARRARRARAAGAGRVPCIHRRLPRRALRRRRPARGRRRGRSTWLRAG